MVMSNGMTVEPTMREGVRTRIRKSVSAQVRKPQKTHWLIDGSSRRRIHGSTQAYEGTKADIRFDTSA